MNQSEEVIQKVVNSNDTTQIIKGNQHLNYNDISQIYSLFMNSEQSRQTNYQQYNQHINNPYLPLKHQYYYPPELEYYYPRDQQYYYPFHQDYPFYQYPPYYNPLQYDYYNQKLIYEQSLQNLKGIKQEYETDKPKTQFEQQKIDYLFEKFKTELIKTEEIEQNAIKKSESDDKNKQKLSQETLIDINNAPKDDKNQNNSITLFPEKLNVKTEENIIQIKQEDVNNIECQDNESEKSGEEDFEKSQELEKSQEENDQSQEKPEKINKSKKNPFQNKKQLINGKSKQSISKNNIRNFLTPIVRMKSSTIDYKLLEKENISVKDFHTFLKKYFYMSDQIKLNIRQTVFDQLLDSRDRTYLKEKKVFALIALKNFQNQFIKLILEKKSAFKTEELHHQFEWINVINDNLVSFLNSIESKE